MRLRPLFNVSIIIKVLLLSLVIGLIVGLVLDAYQRTELRTDFENKLRERLEYEAILDRELFDRQVRAIHNGARLIASQKNVYEYLESPAWQRQLQAEGIRHYHRPPPWLPPASILRAFFTAQVALLLGADGRIREVYHRVPEEQETAILKALGNEPINLLRKLSHNQAYLTSLGGAPYVISSQYVLSGSGRPTATLLLVSAIDNEFLSTAKQIRGEESILSLLDANGSLIIASSNPDAIPVGEKVERLKLGYLMIGKSFFDYGASDLELQIASFVNTARTEAVVDNLLRAEGKRRALLVFTFVLVFTLLAVSVGLRIRRLHRLVGDIAHTLLGISTETGRGDEIMQLEDQFIQLALKLEDTRSDNVSLQGRIVDSEHASRSLRVVTELLAVGVVVDGPRGLEPFNRLMEGLVDDFGGITPFILHDCEHDEIHIADRNGAQRSFSIDHHPDLGARGVLVRENTALRRLEEERDIYANFPAYNPNPLAQVDRKGYLVYANLAMQTLMRHINKDHERELPPVWLKRLDEHLKGGGQGEIEFEVDGRNYSFVAAVLGGRDIVFLFGQDVTEKKQAAHEIKLAAMVTRSVHDGIVVTDVDGAIQQANPAIEVILGYSEGELLGKRLSQLHANRNEVPMEEIWRQAREEGYWKGEVWCEHKQHSNVICLVRINAIEEEPFQVKNYVVVYSDITEHKRLQEWLTHQAFHDALTQLPNRALMEDRLNQNIAQAQRNGTLLAVLYLDLDGFKPVNDRFGHDIGDELLREVSVRLIDCVRSSDTVSRIGGDEFVILLPNLEREGVIHDVALKALDVLHKPFNLAGEEVQISASIGVATYPRDGDNAETLIKAADMAMYDVKRDSKNAYKVI